MATAEHNQLIALQKYVSKNKLLFANVEKTLKAAPDGFDLSTLSFANLFSSLERSTDEEVSTQYFREYTLASGKKARFIEIVIPHDEIEARTIVSEEVNGREQGLLNKENLSDITDTIANQQFYPAIGNPVGESDNLLDLIDIIDGSRRRQGAILEKADYRVLVSEHKISITDAKILAKQLQTAKEHSIREKGKQWQLMMSSDDLDVEQIAKLEQTSVSTVRRAIRAAEIPTEFMALMSDASTITTKQWSDLHSLVYKTLPLKKLSEQEFLDNLKDNETYKALVASESDVNKQDKLIAFLTSPKVFDSKVAVKQPKPRAKKIADFGRSFVKTNNNPRAYTLNFGQISQDMADELNQACLAVMEKYRQPDETGSEQ